MILPASAARSRGITVPLTAVKNERTSLRFRRSLSVDESVKRIARRVVTRDDARAMFTFDQATADAAGVFLIGELERLDQRLHMPLASVTWSRDIDLRTDVSIADERSSFTNSSFAQAQGIAGSNKAWIGKQSSAIVGVSLDIGKTIQPLELWAVQLSWTLPELASAQALGRPVDEQKYMAMQLKHQMDTDEQVYMGDSILGMNGMLNHSSLANTGNAVTGNWSGATAAQILADINSILTSVWTTSAYAVMPDRLLVAPPEYSILVSTLISSAGNISILEFVMRNNLVTANGGKLEILPTKWLLGTNNAGQGPTATDAMFAYRKDPMRLRFPMVPLQRTPLEYRDIRQITTYYGRLGAVELVYPETAARRSNLG
jgi:hypothetical protein